MAVAVAVNPLTVCDSVPPEVKFIADPPEVAASLKVSPDALTTK